MLRTITLLALSACSVASASAALTNHNHSMHAKDTRVYVTLVNKSSTFRDVKIGDHSYTVMPDTVLAVKAPAGTVVYANSAFGKHRRGDVLLQLSSSIDNSRVSIN